MALTCHRCPPTLRRQSVLIVTAEQPEPCASAEAQWLHARAMRNRVAYAQAHGYRLLWNAEQVDPKYPVRTRPKHPG